jgi:ABC-type multidrug transport system permease subunit
LSSNYIREEIIGGVDQRAVHSSWFQLLSEVGWLGPICFVFLLFSLLRQSSNAKILLISNKEYESYFKIVSIECAVLAYFVTATFIDRFRAEVFWWVIVFLMMATNIYYLKQKNTINAESKNK